MQNPPPGYTRVCPYLLYEDAEGAIEYLTSTYGFVQRRSQTGGAGRLHAELMLGHDGLVMLGQAGDTFRCPRRLGAYPAAMVHVYVDDVDRLHGRASNAGAEVGALEMSPAGDRRFTATDPEGQVWVCPTDRLTRRRSIQSQVSDPFGELGVVGIEASSPGLGQSK